MQLCQFCSVTAIGSRDFGRAREAANSLSIRSAYGSYEELIADPEIAIAMRHVPSVFELRFGSDFEDKAVTANFR